MIFTSINDISNNSEKAFFIELTQIYIRLVEVFSQKYSIKIENNTTEDISELQKIGVINSSDDIETLKTTLRNNYTTFIKAVNFAKKHEKSICGLLDNINNSRRRKIQKNAKANNGPTIADFFCGAGGLSLGFIQEGFSVKLANDIEDVCIQTYLYNHPELPKDKLIKGDIKQIVDNIESYVDDDIDVVVGGPPCQGFSEANRQRVIDDPRNTLYKYFVKAVEKIAPKFVVMENVKGMLKVANQVVEDFAKLKTKGNCSYSVAYSVLNSQNFSVAQSRERLIYIAVRSDIAEKFSLRPEQLFAEIKETQENNIIFKLEDALRDIKPLEAPRIKNTNEIDSETSGKKIDVNNYDNNSNTYLSLINCGRKVPFVYNHKARYCSDLNYEIYRRLDQGDDATDEKIKDIMPYAHRNHCFKDKYYKLIADKPCRTITAHLRMDCHSHIHPYQVRAITPREAARIQSFPDDYFFLGPYLKTYMQIGNAVPPMMARGIASVIKKYI